MGYRSDVRIVTSKEGFQKLREFVEEYVKDYTEDYNLLKECDVKEEGKEQCYFGWNYVKWYEGNAIDVDAIMNGLEYLEENDYSYRYMRIGEDKEDYDDLFFDSSKKSEQNLEYPNFIREFDDDYVIDTIKGQQLETVENDKESIDI